jgi:hypothetical protein
VRPLRRPAGDEQPLLAVSCRRFDGPRFGVDAKSGFRILSSSARLSVALLYAAVTSRRMWRHGASLLIDNSGDWVRRERRALIGEVVPVDRSIFVGASSYRRVEVGGTRSFPSLSLSLQPVSEAKTLELVKRSKGTRGMPRCGQARKDAASCEKPWGGARIL